MENNMLIYEKHLTKAGRDYVAQNKILRILNICYLEYQKQDNKKPLLLESFLTTLEGYEFTREDAMRHLKALNESGKVWFPMPGYVVPMSGRY